MGRRRQASLTTCQVTSSASSPVPLSPVPLTSPRPSTLTILQCLLYHGAIITPNSGISAVREASILPRGLHPSFQLCCSSHRRSAPRRVPGGGGEGRRHDSTGQLSPGGKAVKQYKRGGGAWEGYSLISARVPWAKERFCACPPTSTWGVFLRASGADKKGVWCHFQSARMGKRLRRCQSGGGMGR